MSRPILPSSSYDEASLTQYSTPFDYAWRRIFEARLDQSTRETLRNLFPINDDYLEKRQFSRLHQVVLGNSSHCLEEILTYHNVDINSPDWEGNTPLIWAARRNDIRVAGLLLKAGADPNASNRFGTSCLMYAAESSSGCVRLLLRAGADPTHKSRENYNALHHAALCQNDREIIRCLISAGADIHGRNLYGGMPLSSTVFRNNNVSAETLLDYGADVDGLDNDGDSALTEAIRYHSNDLIKTLLNRGAAYTLNNSGGNSILHLAALCGNLGTIQILNDAHLKDIDPKAHNCQKKTPLQLAWERQDKPEYFVERFHTLLDGIRARNANMADRGTDNYTSETSSTADDTDDPETSTDLFADALEQQ